MRILLGAAKRGLLQAIERRGYVVSKQSEFEATKGILENLARLSAKLQQQLDRLIAELQRKEDQLASLREQVSELLVQRTELSAEKADLLREIKALDQRRRDVDAQFREAHESLAQANDEIRRLKIRIEELPEIDYQALMEQQAKLAAFRDAEPAFHALLERVRPFSMTSIERLYAMHKATEYVVSAAIPGDIVECGVWRGGSMMMAALSLLALGDKSRRLILFDTFEGLPKPDQDKDIDIWGHSNYNEWTRHQRSETSSDWACASLEEVRRNMESTGYPMENISFVKGMVQETVPSHVPEAIALLRLDTDWYASTACEMRYLYPRLREQGVLIIDDYGHLKGQRQAIDEYFAEKREPVLLNRIDYSGRLVIKPAGGGSSPRDVIS
jgi:O-methyltransferase